MSARACRASWFAGDSPMAAWYSATASRSLFFSRLRRARSRCLLMSGAMGIRAPHLQWAGGLNLNYIPDGSQPFKRNPVDVPMAIGGPPQARVWPYAVGRAAFL